MFEQLMKSMAQPETEDRPGMQRTIEPEDVAGFYAHQAWIHEQFSDTKSNMLEEYHQASWFLEHCYFTKEELSAEPFNLKISWANIFAPEVILIRHVNKEVEQAAMPDWVDAMMVEDKGE